MSTYIFLSKRPLFNACIARIAVISAFLPLACLAGNRPPVIAHTPVAMAVQGQPIFIRATVSDDTGAIKTATLYFTTSDDVAPFKIEMNPSGASAYSCSIPVSVLQNAKVVKYYIEAIDQSDAPAETSWYEVDVKELGDTDIIPISSSAEGQDSGRSWVKPALIAGGAALAAGGAVLIFSGSGGGGGGSSGDADGSVTNFGNYAGSITTCYQVTGSNTTCSTTSATITVGEDGYATSDTLRQGYFLRAPISGGNFTMVSSVSSGDQTGEIRYVGSIVNTRIIGSVEGSTSSAGGSQGTYSGTFTALFQP